MSTRLAHAQDAREIKAGDAGWFLELDLVDSSIDLAAATALKILYTKPDGVTSGEWDASPHPNDRTVIRKMVSEGDFDVVGSWVLRARYIDTAHGIRLTGDPVRVRVI